MNFETWLQFAGVAAVAIVLPGPAALLCVRHGVLHGPLRALATVFGGTLSALVLMSVSACGLATLLGASSMGFELARAAGAACLVLMGVGAWRQGEPRSTADAGPCSDMAAHALLRQGFLVGISNPKDLLFFGALLPQFIEPDMARVPQFVALFATWALIDAAVMSGYAALGQRLVGALTDALPLRQLQRASGLLLVSFGALLGLQHAGWID